jgi:hypothetical protein
VCARKMESFAIVSAMGDEELTYYAHCVKKKINL